MTNGTEHEIIDLTGETDSSEHEHGDAGSEESYESGSESHQSQGHGEILMDEVSRAQLYEAISATSETRLRQIVKNLVQTMPAVEQALMYQLVTFEHTKRKLVNRWERCENCDEEFDITTDRSDGECTFHPGDLEVDEDQFADWDEACHGPMDTLENRHSYPENFTWSCCEGDGNADGCVHGEHRPGVSKRRRIYG